MTKALYMDPKAVRGPETPIRVPEIPVNTYQKTVKDELGSFTPAEFMNIYRDMCYIREFETMLNLIKTTGEYQGVSYNHPGPAHSLHRDNGGGRATFRHGGLLWRQDLRGDKG